MCRARRPGSVNSNVMLQHQRPVAPVDVPDGGREIGAVSSDTMRSRRKAGGFGVRSGYVANVTLSWVIDTTGRVVEGSGVTVPPRVKVLSGDEQSIYNSFEKVSREAVVQSLFSPAAIGGCKVHVREENRGQI